MIRIAIDNASNTRLKGSGLAIVKISRFDLKGMEAEPQVGDVIEAIYGVDLHTVAIRKTKMRPYWLELEVKAC